MASALVVPLLASVGACQRADFLIAPGPRAGQITPATTIADLRRLYGRGNVKEGRVPGSEGETVRGVILLPEDSTRRAYIYWRDTAALADPRQVLILDAGTRWRTINGISIGTPLAELERLNGRSFAFNGFEWDYGGYADWSSGELETWLGPRAQLCVASADGWRGLRKTSLTESREIGSSSRPTPSRAPYDRAWRNCAWNSHRDAGRSICAGRAPASDVLRPGRGRHHRETPGSPSPGFQASLMIYLERQLVVQNSSRPRSVRRPDWSAEGVWASTGRLWSLPR